MADHVTQGFKGVTGWVDNQTVTVIISLQCEMMYDYRCLSHSGCMQYVHLCADINILFKV